VVLLVSLLLTAQSGDELICPQLGSARDEKWGGGVEEEGERKGRRRKEEKGWRIPICVVPPTHSRVMSCSCMSFCLT
jgi:hypothetical protein